MEDQAFIWGILVLDLLSLKTQGSSLSCYYPFMFMTPGGRLSQYFDPWKLDPLLVPGSLFYIWTTPPYLVGSFICHLEDMPVGG
jgi:hypothetical protein